METAESHQPRFLPDDDDFYTFCRLHLESRYEREPDGLIKAVPYVGGITGIRYGAVNYQLQCWNRRQRLGLVFSSSTAFRLSSASVRLVASTFIFRERWDALTDDQQGKFPPLCPDFVVELVSKSDLLADAKAKMQDDWMANGCRLGWLIDPFNEVVHIYRADGSIQINRTFDVPLSGEDVLPGLEFDLTELRA